MDSKEKKWWVTILVAVIGMCGAVAAAVVSGLLNPEWVNIFKKAASPTATITTAPPSVTGIQTETSPPSSPSIVALTIRDLRPLNTGCSIGGWWADLLISPSGGDGTYIYYLDGDWKAGPITNEVTLHLTQDTCDSIVGTITVESGGMMQSRELFIPTPNCCIDN